MGCHNSTTNTRLKSIENDLYYYKAIKAKIKNIEITIGEIEFLGASPEGRLDKGELIKRREALSRKIALLDNALEALTEKELNLIKLRYFDKLSNEEIANIEYYALNTVGQVIKKILMKMEPILFID